MYVVPVELALLLGRFVRLEVDGKGIRSILLVVGFELRGRIRVRRFFLTLS